MKAHSCLMTGIASITALLFFSTASAAAMPEYESSRQDSAGLNSKTASTYRSMEIETNSDVRLFEALSRTTEYPHYRPPQAASYPSANPPASEKKPEADKDKDKKQATHLLHA